jgi:hypothetical protein
VLGGREVPVDDLLPGLAGDLGGVLGQGPRLVAAQLVGPVLVAFAGQMATAGVIKATGGSAPDAWKRLLGYLVQSFAAPARGLPEPPAPQAMYRSLLRMRPPRG